MVATTIPVIYPSEASIASGIGVAGLVFQEFYWIAHINVVK